MSSAIRQLLGRVLADDGLVAVDLELAGAGVELEHQLLGLVEVGQRVVRLPHAGVADQHRAEHAAEGEHDGGEEDAELDGQRTVGEPAGSPPGPGEEEWRSRDRTGWSGYVPEW